MAESVIEKGIDYVVVTDDDQDRCHRQKYAGAFSSTFAASIKYTEIGDRTQAMQEAMEWADDPPLLSHLLLGRGPVNGMQLADGKPTTPVILKL